MVEQISGRFLVEQMVDFWQESNQGGSLPIRGGGQPLTPQYHWQWKQPVHQQGWVRAAWALDFAPRFPSNLAPTLEEPSLLQTEHGEHHTFNIHHSFYLFILAAGNFPASRKHMLQEETLSPSLFPSLLVFSLQGSLGVICIWVAVAFKHMGICS